MILKSGESTLKILHIANEDDSFGSAKCLYDIMSCELNMSDIEIIILNQKKNKVNAFCRKNGIENYTISYNWSMRDIHAKGLVLFLYRILLLIRHSTKNHLALKNIKKKVDLTSVDLIHTNNCVLDIGKEISDKYQIPHIWQLREHGLKPFRFKPFRFNVIKYMTNSPYTIFVAVSETTKAEWVRLGIPADRILVSYDGVQPCDEMPKRISTDKTRFVMCGAVSETKGVERVVKAIASLSAEQRKMLSLDLWGTVTPDYKKYMTDLIHDNGLENIVKLRGFTNNIWETLADYDVGINCTNFEAFGRCTVEYLMSGMPVLAANTGANTEIAKHKENGFVFERNSLNALKQGLLYFTEHIDEYREKAGTIRTDAISKFSADASSERLVEIFRKAVKNGNR